MPVTFSICSLLNMESLMSSAERLAMFTAGGRLNITVCDWHTVSAY